MVTAETLPSGLRLVTEAMPHVRSITVGVWLARGSRHESEAESGPLRELRIVVANKPGTIAELALALGEAGVNIEDMGLHPAPDMTSGAVSLWVAGAEQAARAAELVRGLGHTVTVLESAE